VQFRDKVLMPAMKKGVKGGFKSAPEAMEVDVKTLLTA
jgi:hypothetical protein